VRRPFGGARLPNGSPARKGWELFQIEDEPDGIMRRDFRPTDRGPKPQIENLSFIRKTNGRIEQTMKIENCARNTKVLVATRGKLG
jgi:hypothetical protein